MKSLKNKIDFNPEFKKALELMEDSRRNLFITGKAGTGKSTLLKYFRSTTKKRIVVLAPTGVAAVNISGQTIHSFFNFKPTINLQQVKKIKNPESAMGQMYKNIDTIIIDEVSMVRADLLDCVDRFLRLNGKDKNLPFGGTQMIFIGDLYQLPPVLTGQEREIFNANYDTPYFFSAKVFSLQDLFKKSFDLDLIELEKVYRQKDDIFIDLLNKVRNNNIDEQDLEKINIQCNKDFINTKDDLRIWLTSTNDLAKDINSQHLEGLPSKEKYFSAATQGFFEAKYYPTENDLRLKKNCQVMLLNNDTGGRWVNGTIGKIIDFIDDGTSEEGIRIALETGGEVTIFRHTWEIFNYSYDYENKKIKTETAGSFTQYPVKLAWAVTIHKSQGKTFNKVIIDLGRGTFAHGQAYVALSRCTSLQGIVLKKPLTKSHLIMDYRVVKFITELKYRQSEKDLPLNEKMLIIEEAIKEAKELEFIYLKRDDSKTQRKVRPIAVGMQQYQGAKFFGLSAYCYEMKSEITFRLDRIIAFI